MSSHPPSTGMTIALSTEDSYLPYMVEEDTNKARAASEPPGLDKHSEKRQPRLLTFYRSISWILGFRDKYSLLNCFVWGGALVGICLARTITLNPGRTPHLLIPGEWFWLSQSIYKPNLFIHIYFATLIFHRINGYAVLFCLIVAVTCGSNVARRAFGGEVNSQSAYYIQAMMIIYAALMGIYNVKKDTWRHRKARFPQCAAAGINPANIYVAVHASTHDPPLYVASAARAAQGMALWIAILIHIIGVEFYIFQTDAANQVRLNFALEPRDFTEN
ncbi:hypothetical protein C8J57DRAFT_1308393 [Mycena rebaudengoi]|nr:hypothetical protein C8J57DRAFT_1308393 [Mycena rebaudengoi]